MFPCKVFFNGEGESGGGGIVGCGDGEREGDCEMTMVVKRWWE